MLRAIGLFNVPNLFGAGKAGYSDNADIPGSDPTYMDPANWNATQEEICAPIEEVGGMAVDGSDNHQLLKAINLLAGIGLGVSAPITANTVLTSQQRGTIMIDATAADVLVTLPSADCFMDFTFVRVDNTSHKVTVSAAGAEKVMHNLWVNPAGYGFIRLFGAGDYWTCRSAGAGQWWPVDRLNRAVIGSLEFNTGSLAPAGGLIVPDGTTVLRTDFPWLWDFAQASSNLRSEAAWTAGGNGGYSVGDGATTFRLPDPRGEFLRVLDGGRGVDAARVIGSWASHQLQDHTHNVPLTIISNNLNAAGGPVNVPANSANTATTGAISGNVGAETRPRSVALPVLLKVI